MFHCQENLTIVNGLGYATRYALWQVQVGSLGQRVSILSYDSGPYQLVLSKPEFRRRLRTIVNVAIVHDLYRLRACYLVLSDPCIVIMTP
jgi:hypothetical protein